MKDGHVKPAPVGDLYRHMWLTKAVSEAVGVNLSESRGEGHLEVLDYSRMLINCRNAACAKTCALWLTQQQDIANAPPDFCVNRETLKRLKP